MKLALFDLDHTLLPIDSDQSWGDYTIRIGWCDPTDFKRQNDAFYEDYLQGRLDIHAYVRFATAAAVARGPAVAEAARAGFMQEVIEPALRPAALALIERHRRAGETLVLVTATHEFVTRPIAQRLGIPHLIATELARDAQGWFTGEIAGTPALGPGKVSRLQQWLEAQGLGWADVDATFYSDSRNDIPLLEKVQRPVATNPDTVLRAHAQARGWPILELFSPA